jgi:hypothetical protein
MSSTTSFAGEDEIDSAWGERAPSISGTCDLEQPEMLATESEARLRQDDLGFLAWEVIEALHIASSAMLQPFEPSIGDPRCRAI